MNIPYEFFAIVSKFSKKCGIISIKTIKTDPLESNSIFPGSKDHIKRLFMLCLECYLIFGDFGFLAAFSIFYPVFGQK